MDVQMVGGQGGDRRTNGGGGMGAGWEGRTNGLDCGLTLRCWSSWRCSGRFRVTRKCAAESDTGLCWFITTEKFCRQVRVRSMWHVGVGWGHVVGRKGGGGGWEGGEGYGRGPGLYQRSVYLLYRYMYIVLYTRGQSSKGRQNKHRWLHSPRGVRSFTERKEKKKERNSTLISVITSQPLSSPGAGFTV